ncbi:protein phosphatase 2C domain-containing protein [Actinomadura monticuli]|uniref:Protein phosphatase 2C domain-containing protein n=1 Tax=Actinomadura monticuli TaxID=3097367 RepID=A0ABV4Q9T3_9ACTN
MTDDQTGADAEHAAAEHAKAAELSCPECGEIVYAEEVFCEKCGHRLTDAPSPAEPAAPERAPGRPCAGCGGTAIDADGYCEQCGLRQPAERDHLEFELPAAGGSGGRPPLAAGASDRGRRYSRNEDAIAVAAHAAGVAAVVSDGVGSSQRPEDASRTAADTGAAELVARLDAGEDPEDATRHAALRAAAAVAALATSPSDAPSCTYVSAVTRGTTVTVGWVGDSRAYWLSADGAAGPGENDPAGPAPDAADTEVSTGDMAELGPSRRLTEDDSWAAFMVSEGSLTEAEAEAHPNAHVITAWLGVDAGEVRPHVATFRPAGPGTLLICSDGLWNYFPAAGDLAALLGGPGGANGAPDPASDPLEAARTLVRHALDAGGRDNITVAVIPLPSPAAPASRADHRRTAQSLDTPQSTEQP